MSQKFQAAVHHRDDVSFVKLSGVIDEDNELTDLTDKIQGSTVIIDLGEVERINSCGVRDWVNWLGKVEGGRSNTEIVLVECSPAIVAQINLVNNFTGSGVVKSFYVPYFCPECDEEKVLLCETADMGPAPHEPPTCRCDECDLVMDFDDMPDSYFAFLANQKKVARPEKIQSIIDEFASGDDDKSKIRSRVGSQANISGANIPGGSLPTVPSLPSISRTPTGNRGFAELSSGTGSGMGMPSSAATMGGAAAAAGKSGGGLVYALVGVLFVAIVVLGVLLFTG
jgi:anti-anti-sigma regulatory factor